jgi:triosephosphate isomerase (TIM)
MRIFANYFANFYKLNFKNMLEKKKRYIIANWKMKLSHQETMELTKELIDKYEEREDLEVVLCPSAVSLMAVGEEIAGTVFKLGAQNVFYHDRGAYTGETSPSVAKELGCKYVIIGHSERRKIGETDDEVNRKVIKVLEDGLTPIICVGETFEEYQEKKTEVVIIGQVTKALEDVKLKEGQKIIIAYEPVWVIGSGQAVEQNVVEQIVQIIMHTAIELDLDLVDKFEVIYGGSVDEENVNDFIIGNISRGVIVGNSSLEADKFINLLKNIK